MSDSHWDLEPWEGELRSWADPAIAARIRWLVRYRLQHLGDANDGYDRLYQDPADGRLWEYTHPWPEAHGGGPYLLSVVAKDEVRSKYGRASA